MKLAIVLGLIAIALFFVWACCVTSGECSRREEEWEDLYDEEEDN